MFWFGKGKKDNDKKKAAAAPGGKPSREDLIAQAQAAARAARERLGDETIQKIAESMKKFENSATERAKNQIKAMDSGHVADHLKFIIDEKE